MANEYLIKEYELCFEQLRFYDERHEKILTYTFNLTAAAATARFARGKARKSRWCAVHHRCNDWASRSQ